jgi:uncharacterized protein YdeI (YjbR/CyaY-like superfamily)
MDVGKTLTVRSRDAWRKWLAAHHTSASEIWLVYNKKSSGRGGITYEDSVEEALCYGWVDGQIRSLDAMTYAGRFTPRKPQSSWAASNIARVKRLIDEGRMAPAGIATLPPELRNLAERRR